MNGEVRDALVNQLAVFQYAGNWKRTLATHIRPHLGPEVLEVGAGIGGTTQWLCDQGAREWCCLEPDPTIHAQLAANLENGQLPSCCRSQLGDVSSLPQEQAFDAILYVDVLEHIQDDGGELRRAVLRLKPGGRLVVMSPAHQFLFSEFDAAIGHLRRYDLISFGAILPCGLETVKLHYLDSVGFMASLANRLFLRQALPNLRQILVWDRFMVRMSNLLDPLIGHRAGKSLFYVGRRMP
jgi:SAM-dependent methyltransferase